jgi:hypothetical protein
MEIRINDILCSAVKAAPFGTTHGTRAMCISASIDYPRV